MGGMFLEVVRSPGLAHLSYIVGHGGRAAVIDPRRDVDAYLDIARKNGAVISHIFETHRNEDYVIGSVELARKTGAAILHGKALPFTYGRAVAEGERIEIGKLVLSVLETPGHTFESISVVLADTASGPDPVAVFTGDALFVGDVGRTDFFPDRAAEVAGLLFDSIHEKLLPLGDHVLIYPAHGAGSVCGRSMAEREFSTIGIERLQNALLALDKPAFIARKTAERHPLPPYFKLMEGYNLNGNAPRLCDLAPMRPFSPAEFEAARAGGLFVLDIRSPEAIAGAFIPGSLAVPLEMLAAWGGFFLPSGARIGLVANDPEDAAEAVKRLWRMGYDAVAGILDGGLGAWETSGRDYDRIPSVHVSELVARINAKVDFTLLDVRTPEETAGGVLPGALPIPLDHLTARLAEVPRDKPVTTFCGSGARAIIAASILKNAGFAHVEDSLGSMAACRAWGCPLGDPA